MLLAAVAGNVSAQPADQNDGSGLTRLESFLDEVHSLTADFRQELWTADQRLIETETGTLALERPNRFRWIYSEPKQLTVVADGKRIWIYDVELAQATVAPLDDSITSSPAMLLSGDRSVRDSFDVEQTYTLDGLDWVKLIPKAAGSDFSSVRIGFSGNAPQRLELVDGLNQVTRVEFSNLAVNPPLTEDTFEFDPPSGVDVIGGEG